jgi:hypothetical protein
MSSIYQIYYPFIFLQILLCFLLLLYTTILSLLKRDPLKSRGIYPFLVALFFFLGSSDLLWNLIFDLEILSYFRCFTFNFLYHPLFSGGAVLVLIRSMRFTIYNWLHKNKQKLSKNKRNYMYRVAILIFKIISKW